MNALISRRTSTLFFATSLVLLVSEVLLSLPLPARAQSDDTPPPSLGNATPAGLPGTVSCFDYYHFGSVQVDISPTVSSAVSGTPITFTGVIKNANTYPIVDGDVYIKIFRDRGDGSKDSNGPDVVEQYYALEGISIPAGGSKPVDITWNIPAYAASGSYKVATFFTVSHKFNLLGLPFTDDVVGNTASFRISGEQKAAVGLKKDAVTVGGEKYHFAAFPPREGASGDVKIEAVLVNPTNQSVTVPLTWTLYSWSGNDPNNAIGTRTEQVTIPASGQKLVSYTVSDSQYPVYLLTGGEVARRVFHHQCPLRARRQKPHPHQFPRSHQLSAHRRRTGNALLVPPQRRHERRSARFAPRALATRRGRRPHPFVHV